MAKGGTIKEQLAQVEKDLNEEAERWEAAEIPFVGNIYRMGNNEFMHHVHVLALQRMLKEYLGLTNDQCDLMIKRVFLEEMRTTFVLAQKARSDGLRQSIVDGINIIRPPEQ